MSDLTPETAMGQAIRAERRRLDLTQDRLQELTGIEQSVISDMENGRSLSFGKISQIARAFGTKASALVVLSESYLSIPEPSSEVTQLIECPDCGYLQTRDAIEERYCSDCESTPLPDEWLEPKILEVREGTPIYEGSKGLYGALIVIQYEGVPLESVLTSEHLIAVTTQLANIKQAQAQQAEV